ncbi:MAG: hypothetical protein KJ908_10520 [Acidobacteria bacterium]|nr:hypothetical protein [Acidobacteriota bacterium]MBU4203704.1 hypothetical protein [Acidobacteriota bacterium]MBU4495139.1 hypothetical protein [Acidobacteriota bacterium]
MVERGISPGEINIVLDDPRLTYPGKNGRIIMTREVSPGRTIQVVTMVERDCEIVVTAMVLDK